METKKTSSHYRRNIWIVIGTMIIGFILSVLCQIDKYKHTTTSAEGWTISAGIFSFLAIVAVLLIYTLDNLEKESDRKEAMRKEHNDRQEAMEKEHKDRQEAMKKEQNDRMQLMYQQSKERLFNKNLMVLINFMLHYLSIESSLFAGILNEKERMFTYPDYIGTKYMNVQISRDNIFAFLNILYAIDYCVTKSVESNNILGNTVTIVDLIAFNTIQNTNWNVVSSAAMQSGINYAYFSNGSFYVNVQNELGRNKNVHFKLYSKDIVFDDSTPEKDRKAYLIAYKENNIPIYAVAYNFGKQIKERLDISIDEIKKIDKACRKEVGYPIGDYLRDTVIPNIIPVP